MQRPALRVFELKKAGARSGKELASNNKEKKYFLKLVLNISI
jgi:hypothetical protein